MKMKSPRTNESPRARRISSIEKVLMFEIKLDLKISLNVMMMLPFFLDSYSSVF